ncbi:alpha-ribazole kinase [Anaerovirgula multivorans]|uniref:Alpha-ribazole kinase n=1 Tax=Anaerovirgula multivorans TaxID=312168 RepID=A0A239EN40_9FIRM|nr:AIR synthase related protein [Anaerovirgula multivorans]SNS46160.1 alpha-ribazole kinase [Anaerovirgula multivorans]
MQVEKFRDLTLIEHTADKLLVIACDSCGGIGSKENDVLKVPPEIVGYYTARVALMEVLSVGAEVLTVIDTLSVEMESTGRRIVQGIEGLLEEAEIQAVCLNGSTEENIQTSQTAMGITIIGEVEKASIKVKTSSKGNQVVLLGIPKVGSELNLPFDEEICSIEDLRKLLSIEEVNEIYPVGSKGIFYEAKYLGDSNGCLFKVVGEPPVDMNKSAGPATAVIFTIEAKNFSAVEKKVKKPLQIIGELI